MLKPMHVRAEMSTGNRNTSEAKNAVLQELKFIRFSNLRNCLNPYVQAGDRLRQVVPVDEFLRDTCTGNVQKLKSCKKSFSLSTKLTK